MAFALENVANPMTLARLSLRPKASEPVPVQMLSGSPYSDIRVLSAFIFHPGMQVCNVSSISQLGIIVGQDHTKNVVPSQDPRLLCFIGEVVTRGKLVLRPIGRVD